MRVLGFWDPSNGSMFGVWVTLDVNGMITNVSINNATTKPGYGACKLHDGTVLEDGTVPAGTNVSRNIAPPRRQNIENVNFSGHWPA